jgi:hypothetical protein
MLENLFSASTPLAVRFILALLGVIVVIGILAFAGRVFSKPRVLPLPPVQIANIIEQAVESSGGVASAAVLLIIFSVVSAIDYFAATTVFEQIVALLIWIGNGIFWGVIMIVAALGRRRTYIVYRDAVPTERREPRFETT